MIVSKRIRINPFSRERYIASGSCRSPVAFMAQRCDLPFTGHFIYEVSYARTRHEAIQICRDGLGAQIQKHAMVAERMEGK